MKCIYLDYGDTIDILLDEDEGFHKKIKTFMKEIGECLDFKFGINNKNRPTTKQNESKRSI